MKEQSNESALKDRDFTLIIDKSGLMTTPDTAAGTRWQGAHEVTQGLAASKRFSCRAWISTRRTLGVFGDSGL